MAVFTESFTSGDNVPLGDVASTCDLPWIHIEGADPWATFGSQASPRGNVRGFVEYARAEVDTDGSDMYAQVLVTTLSTGSQGGPGVRFNSIDPVVDPAGASTFYGVEVFGNGDISIQLVEAGARTAIGSGTVTVTLPQTLRLEITGDSLRALWGGVEVATATNTVIPTGTRGGIMGFEQTGQGLGLVIDSFEVGDLGGVVPSEGTAAPSLGLELAATGSRASAGSTGFGVGLELAATGSRPSAGTAGFGVGLELQATGSRSSVGTAAPGMGFELAATGSRPSQGEAHFTIGLALAAFSSVAHLPDLTGAVTVQGLTGSVTTDGLSGAAATRGLTGTVS